MNCYNLSKEEQARRKRIAERARKMILAQLPVEDQDETSLTWDTGITTCRYPFLHCTLLL